MKKIILIFFGIILQHILVAQTSYNLTGTISGTTISTCSAILYDSGGPTGSYQSNEDYTVTFCSTNGDCINLSFVSMDIEQGWEYLTIHDGNSTTASTLATISGSTLPASITSSGSCITLHFTSDGSVTYDGFQINISCTGNCYVPPPPPTNNDPCSGIALTVDTVCNYQQYTNVGATNSGIATPSCASGYSGGDVWFTAVVPASGRLQVSIAAQTITDGGIAIYSGSNCNSITEIDCEENTWSMPGPVIISSTMGLAGQTVWIRVWEGDNDNPGVFNICAIEPPPSLEIDNITYTPQQLVDDILVTGCLDAFNIQFTGDPSQIGYFNNGQAAGFQSGVILSSGNVTDASGYGNNDFASTDQGGSGFPLVTGSNDAAVLEFDFIPASDTLRFNFVFGSEEYPEFANSSYNDFFAFLLTGPNPSGGNYAQMNIALIPGTTTPITINNINNGSNSPPSGPCTNCAYYIDNYAGNLGITYDGFTVPLTAEALVTPCQTYHIELVVADILDNIYDSAVLLEAGSFSSGGQVSMQHFSSLTGNHNVLEGCENYFVFSRIDTTDTSDSVQVLLSVSGTATMGTDYSPFPSTFYIPSGQIYDTIYYSAFMDNIPEGNEYIVISLTNGCPCNLTTVTDTLYIYDNYDFNPSISTDTMICSGQPLTIQTQINPLLNSGFISYIWSTGQTTSSIQVNPLVPTTYTVTISDPCYQDTILSMFTGILPDIIVPVSVSDDSLCIGETTLVSFIGSVGPNASLQWSFPGGTPSSAGGAGPHSVSWSSSGSQTVNLQIIDNGCTGDTTINIYVIPNPAFTLIPVDVTCFGNNNGSISLNPTGQFLPYLYNWSNGTQNQNIQNIGPGSYSITVTNAYGCSGTSSALINQPAVLSVSNSTHPVSCFGGSDGAATASVTGGTPPYQYIWNDLLGQTTSTAQNLNAGSYMVTITDANNCTVTGTAIILQPAQSIMGSIIPDAAHCFGQSSGSIYTSISGGTQPYAYIWNNGSHNQNQVGLPAGTYTVTVSDANSCTIVLSADIVQPSEIIVEIVASETTCFGGNDGNINVTTTGGYPPYTYVWNNSMAGSNIDNLPAGRYTVTVTDSTYCTSTASILVDQPSKVEITTSPDPTICIGQSTQITSSITGGTSPYTTLWNNGSTTSAIIVSPTTSTSYTVQATDANGCLSDVKTVNLIVNPPIQASATATPQKVCNGEPILINISASGGNSNYLYTIDSVLSGNPSWVYPLLNTTNITITVSDDCGSPSVNLNVPVEVIPLPPINFTSDVNSGCEPLTVQFIEQNPDQGQSYLWTFGDIDENNTSIQKNPIHVFDEPGIYSISLSVTSIQGCTNQETIPMMIEVYPVPNASFIPNPETVDISNTNVLFQNLSTEIFSCLWNFGDGDSSNLIEPWHVYPAAPGTYWIELIVESAYGCRDTIKQPLVVDDEFTFYAPTAFSPDDDGINDLFYIRAHGIKTGSFLLKIFDRWGNQIFETENPDIPWNGHDGTGKTAPIGSYTWLVIYKDMNDITHERAGSITIIK